MLRNILVPVDGSALSERAVLHARALARANSARLILVRALLGGQLYDGDEPEWYVDERLEADHELSALATSARQDGLEVSWHIVNDEAGYGILEAARTYEVDLIVMSTHGRTGVSRAVSGSVADRVVRGARVPVLLIPPTASADWAIASPLRILIPLDGSPEAEEALEIAPALVLGRTAELALLQAIVPPNYATELESDFYAEYDPALERALAQDYLEGVAARLRQLQLTIQIQVAEGDPPAVILDAVRELPAQLVVMTTHGRGGLVRLLLGSTADGVLRRSATPLLLVRPEAARIPPDEIPARAPVVEPIVPSGSK
jgi:nucleotide-binding universal stress UspA family protein